MTERIDSIAGNTVRIRVTVQQDTGAVLNITKAWFAVKDPELPSNYIAYNTVSNPANIIISNNVTPAPVLDVFIPDTDNVRAGDYVYDFKITLATGDVKSMDHGVFTVIPGIAP